MIDYDAQCQNSNIDMPLDQYLEIVGGSAIAQGDVLIAFPGFS